jgi:DNA-binding GntR family transcriptional regulator
MSGCHDNWFLWHGAAGEGILGAPRGLSDAVLDRASPVPLYYQLAQNMETAIRSGRLSSGSHLENEIDLARQLRVSRPTVRRAIAILANRGLVIRRHGIGTLVVPVKIRRPVRLSSLYDDLAEAGQTPTTRLLAFETVPAAGEVATSLQVSRGSRVLHFERLRMASGQPIALMRNFLPLSLQEIVTEDDLKTNGLYRLLKQAGIHLRLASQTIGARGAQLREAKLLKVPSGSPLLTMRRISYDDAGQPVEYGSHVYPAERYSFEMSVVADSKA